MNRKEIGDRLEQMDIELSNNPETRTQWLNFQNIVGKAMKEFDSTNQLSISEAVTFMPDWKAEKLLKDVNDSLNWSPALSVALNLKHMSNAQEVISTINELSDDMVRLVLRAYVFHWNGIRDN
jgi:hypothetical protein